MADMLLTGLTGLTAFRRVLDTTSHNIANATTEGYSRQTVELDANNPQFTGSGYVGTGVSTTAVKRTYDQFLSTQFRNSSSASSDLDAYLSFAKQIDSVLANENIGLSTVLQDFFNAVQAVADDPTSIPARQVLLTEGDVLESRFGTLDQLFTDITTQATGALKDTVNSINTLGASIADINNKIIVALGGSPGLLPNDLLDQRDKLIDDLSKLVNVSTNEQENGAVNVFIGSGQSLVLGVNSNTLLVKPSQNNPEIPDIVFQQGSSQIVVTQFMTGGEIGGTLRFMDEVLDTAVGTLGQIALAISSTVNEQHTNGLDLDGEQGLDFFNLPIEPIQINGSSNALAVSVADPSALTTDNYFVTRVGANYTVTNLNTLTSSTSAGADIDFEGLTFDLASVVDGDEFLVRPTHDAARNFALAITDPRDIAIALPVVSEKVPTNTGTAGLNNVSINGLSTNILTNSISLTFDSVNNEYDFSYGAGPTTGSIAYDPAVDSGKEAQISVAGFGNISFTLTGQPANGDSFNLIDNAGGVGDNRNGLLLANLQTTRILSGGTATFQDTYGQVVADVGRRTQAAEVNGAAQNGLLAQTIASKDAVSGVSLDEEAANLIRFQQAYQAASQVVLTSRTIFDTLLGAFR